jgi:hypothetical protein
MTPTVIAVPLAVPAHANETARPAAPPDLRPVEGSARGRWRYGDARPAEFRETRPESSLERPFDRRRPQPERFQPPRPQPGGFLAQVLGQQALDGLGGEAARGAAESGAAAGVRGDGAFRLLPDAAARGSEAYRRAGAEPALYSEEPAFYRILA